MEVDTTVVNYISTTIYNILPIEQSIKQLWGYNDRNFLLVDSSNHQIYVLKIINEDESMQELTDIVDEIMDSAHFYFTDRASDCFVVVPKLVRTSANKLSTLVDINLRNAATGDLEHKRCNVKLFEYFDGISLFDFIRGHKSNSAIISETYFQVGRQCNHLFKFLRTQNHLTEQLQKCRQGFTWQLSTCESFLRNQIASSGVVDEFIVPLIAKVLEEYSAIKSRLSSMPPLIVHSDLNARNILMDPKTMEPTCLIDFNDVQVGNQLTDLSIAMLYGVLDYESDFRRVLKEIPAHILRGYKSVDRSSISDDELDIVLTLMKLRLCQSLVNAEVAQKRDPDNACAVSTLKTGKILLEIMVQDEDYSDPKTMAQLWRDLSQ